MIRSPRNGSPNKTQRGQKYQSDTLRGCNNPVTETPLAAWHPAWSAALLRLHDLLQGNFPEL
jgi:hypothetical protein